MVSALFRSLCVLVVACGALLAQDVKIQLEVNTHLNTPTAISLSGNRLFAATTGGHFVYDFAEDRSRIYTSVDGFYNHYFTAMTLDKRGRVILGTLDGILSILNPDDESVRNDQNLQGDVIVDMVSVEDTLWVLSRRFVSVFLFDPERNRYQFRESYKDFDTRVDEFYSIAYANNRIWLAGDVGLVSAPAAFLKFNLYAVTNWRTRTTADGLPGNRVVDVISAPDDRLYLATSGGVARYDFTTFTRLPSSNAVNTLRYRDGFVYGASTQQVYRISDSQTETLYTIAAGSINDFILDDNGDIWTAIEKRGVRNLKSGAELRFDGPLDNYIGEVLVDRQGRVWATAGKLGDTRNQGIFLKTEAGWENYFFSGGNSNYFFSLNSSNAILEDDAGNIWFGSWGGGLVIFDREGNINPLSPVNEPGQVWVYSSTRSDTLPIQTDAALLSRVSPVNGANQFVTVITDIFYDTNRQSLWVLNYQPASNAPLVEYRLPQFGSDIGSDASWNSFGMPSGNVFVHKMTQDFVGDLWLATAQGVVQLRFNGDQYQFEIYNESDNLKNNNVRAIAADQDGYIWTGTESGANAILNRQVFDLRDTFQPIGLGINDIYVDSQNNKWFATDKGLSVLKAEGSPFDPQSWIHIIPFNSSLDPEQVAFRPFVYRENLPTENINSVYLDEKTGDVYLGTQNGLAILRGNPFAGAFDNFDQLSVGPNPFVLGAENSDRLRFRRLIPGSEVKILTVNGQLIRQLNREALDEVAWDGRNETGEPVNTGVYVYLVTGGDGQSRSGKVLVVNEE